MSGFLTSSEVMISGLQMENKEYLQKNFKVRKMPKRGRSVCTMRSFKKGDYVMEYKGMCQKYSENQYLSLQQLYEKNDELSYCLEFNFQNEKYYIDATREYEYGFARLINHARNPNIKLFKPLLIGLEQMPKIAMYAACDIGEGEELFWDYFASFNPVKCLIGTTDRKITTGMKWMFSRRTKTGKLISKQGTSNRGGLCMICYTYKRKLSNHLIKVHELKSPVKRSEMIREGREMVSADKPERKTSSERRLLHCPFCDRCYRQLSVHLSRVHHLKDDRKKEIMKKSRNKIISKEINDRKIKYVN